MRKIHVMWSCLHILKEGTRLVVQHIQYLRQVIAKIRNWLVPVELLAGPVSFLFVVRQVGWLVSILDSGNWGTSHHDEHAHGGSVSVFVLPSLV